VVEGSGFFGGEVGRYGSHFDGLDEADTMGRKEGREGGKEVGREGWREGGREGGRGRTYLEGNET